MKMELRFLSLLTLFIFIILQYGCSTSDVKVKEREYELKRDYVVIDSNLDVRPIWVSDVQAWAKDSGNVDKYVYFSFETTPKIDREVACDLAKTNARADIASEIDAEMVIMGTHGIKGMQKFFGSWALKVIANSKVPFIVIQEPPKKDLFENIERVLRGELLPSELMFRPVFEKEP